MKSTNAEARLAIKNFKDSLKPKSEDKHKFKLGDSYELDMSKFEDAVEGEKYAQDYVKELSNLLNKTFGAKSTWLTDWIKDSENSSRIIGYTIVRVEKPRDPNAKNNPDAKGMAERDKELFESYLKHVLPNDVKYEITKVQERWQEGWNPENRVIDFALTIPVGVWSKTKPEAKNVNIDELYIMSELYGTEDSKVKDAESKGEKIAKVIAKALKGECGPVGGEDPKLDGNKVGLYSQMPTEWFKFNDDGSVDSVNLKELLEKYPSDYGVENKEDIDAIVKEYGHFASVKDLLHSDLSWFMYLDDEPKILKEVDSILKEEVKDDLSFEENDDMSHRLYSAIKPIVKSFMRKGLKKEELDSVFEFIVNMLKEDDELRVIDAKDSIDDILRLAEMLGRAHDEVMEAQDLAKDLVENEELDDSIEYDLDDLEAAVSEFEFMGESDPAQALLEKYGVGGDSDEEDW